MVVRTESDPALRRTYIGGSEAAAAVGLGRWGSPYSVWLAKTSDEEQDEPSERMQWGTLLESPVAEEWARREGMTLRKPGFRRDGLYPFIGGHADFLATPLASSRHWADGERLVEVKVSDRPSDWEGEGADAVPMQYFLQVQYYLYLYRMFTAEIVVLLRGSELRSFRIDADTDVQVGLVEGVRDLWENHVVPGIPPEADGHEATAEAIKRRFPEDDMSEIVGSPMDQVLVSDLLEARFERSKAQEREDTIANRIKDRMGSVSRLLVPQATISWRNNKPSTKTNWEAVAKVYRRVIEGRENLAGADLDAIESIHTDTIPGPRVFRVTLKREE